MNPRSWPLRLLAAGTVAVAIAACRPSPVTTTPAVVATVTAKPSLPTVVPTVLATSTAVPPTETPSPRATATLAPTSTATAAPVAVAKPSNAVTTIQAPPARDLVDLVKRLKPSATRTAQPTKGPPPDYAVGAEQTFWVANQIASNYFQMHAKIVYKTTHAYWYVQDGLDIPTGDCQAAADYFENQTYSTEHKFFGSEWTPGVDGDAHITILIGQIPGVGGYYSTADEYTKDVNPYSNQREMIYINADAVRPGGTDFNGTVAHEFMHMIQFNVHRWQNSWLDEGSAELAAQAVTGSASSAVGAFEHQPQTQLNAWASDPTAATPHYGAAYLFMRYVTEQYGGFQSIGKVIAEPSRGMVSFERFFQTLKPPRTFDQVFADWVAANALDDPTLADGRFGYHSLHLSVAIQPGPSIGANVTGKANQYGATYYRIQPAGPTTITFSGTPQTRLIGADPHGAPFEWWSNRGDSVDSRLTRSVDLRSVKKATLHFWVWYNIEKDFDYGYVEASSDGGATWRTLPASDTTSSDPNGQNYGNGFTGNSGGQNPAWVPETVDLNAYTGHQILLRFEYVTDDSFNADGMALDNVEIPEIGFRDSTLSDDGWQAAGFVRIDNKWPESYLVEVITPSSKTPVQEMKLDGNERGTLNLAGGPSVILAVAGLAPITTQPAPFELGVSRR